MRKNQTIILGNEDFKYKGVISKEDLKYKSFKGLYECYNRPSDTKTRIYIEWSSRIYDLGNMLKFGINGYNCHMFTLHSILKVDTKDYYIYITKTRQEIYEIEGGY